MDCVLSLDLSVYRDPLHERDLNLPPANLHPKVSIEKMQGVLSAGNLITVGKHCKTRAREVLIGFGFSNQLLQVVEHKVRSTQGIYISRQIETCSVKSQMR